MNAAGSPSAFIVDDDACVTRMESASYSVKVMEDLNRNLRLNNLHRRLARGRHARGVWTDKDKPAPDNAQHSN